MTQRSLISALGLSLLTACCGGAAGQLQRVEPTPHFIASSEEVLADVAGSGWVRLQLNGQRETPLGRPGLHLLTATHDLQVRVFSDSQTHLWIAQGDGAPARVPALDRRLSEVALSPDGLTLAATRHADFDDPLRADEDDDGLWLITLPGLEVRALPPVQQARVHRLRWTADGASLVMSYSDGSRVLAALPGGERTPWPPEVEGDPAPLWSAFAPVGQPSPRCEATGDTLESVGWRGDQGLAVRHPDGSLTPLVEVVGRERGFHDYLPTLDGYFFSRTCEYALFNADDPQGGAGLYVVEVASRRVARIAHAGQAWPTPSAP